MLFLSSIVAAAELGCTLGGAIATIKGAELAVGAAVGTVAGACVGAVAEAVERVAENA